jgi:hypothetical protein
MYRTYTQDIPQTFKKAAFRASPFGRGVKVNLDFRSQCVSLGISRLYKNPLVNDKRVSNYYPQRGTYLLHQDAKLFRSTKARNLSEIKQVSNQDNLPVYHQMSRYHFQPAESKALQLPEVFH